MKLSHDSSWQLETVQDYRNRKNRDPNSQENNQITANNDPQNKLAILAQKATTEELFHKEMSELIYYAIKTIRSKASKGESITTRDGFTYRYDKDPNVLKWVSV